MFVIKEYLTQRKIEIAPRPGLFRNNFMDPRTFQEITGKSDDALIKNSHLGGSSQRIVSELEMTRRLKNSIDALNESVVSLDKATARYSWIMIALTAVITILTVVMLFKS